MGDADMNYLKVICEIKVMPVSVPILFLQSL